MVARGRLGGKLGGPSLLDQPPALDDQYPVKPESLAKELGVGSLSDPYVVVIQHPLSSQIEEAGAQMRETLAAIEELKIQAFVIYPNSDAGSDAMIRAIMTDHPRHLAGARFKGSGDLMLLSGNQAY